MNDKKLHQAIMISVLAIVVIVAVIGIRVHPILLDLSPESQHILQNYQNYLQTGQTSIPINPSPIDQNQTGSPNQATFCEQAVYLKSIGKPTTALQDQYCAAAYAQFLTPQNTNLIFGSLTTWIIIGIVILLIAGIAISAARS